MTHPIPKAIFPLTATSLTGVPLIEDNANESCFGCYLFVWGDSGLSWISNLFQYSVFCATVSHLFNLVFHTTFYLKKECL